MPRFSSNSVPKRIVHPLIAISLASLAVCGRDPGGGDHVYEAVAGTYDLVAVHSEGLPAAITSDAFTVIEANSGVVVLGSDRRYSSMNVISTRSGGRVRVDTSAVAGTYIVRNDSVLLTSSLGAKTGLRIEGGGILTFVNNMEAPFTFKRRQTN